MAITNHIEKVQNSLPLGRVSEVINVLYTNGFMSMNHFYEFVDRKTMTVFCLNYLCTGDPIFESFSRE